MSGALAERQQQLMAFLKGDESVSGSDIRHHVVEQGAIDISTRLGIYKNAYKVRLVETIDTDHPVLGIYLGDDLYDQMITDYINQYPSQNFSLRHFADLLPKFLLQQSPFKEYPQIAALARFERLLLTAFDAADTHRTTREELQSIPQSAWPTMTIRFHPSVQLFQCRWNVVDIWKAIKAEKSPPELIESEVAWLLWRNSEQLTEFRVIDSVAVAMLTFFQQGKDFSEICDGLLDILPEHEVSECAVQTLLRWIDNGIVQGIKYS